MSTKTLDPKNTVLVAVIVVVVVIIIIVLVVVYVHRDKKVAGTANPAHKPIVPSIPIPTLPDFLPLGLTLSNIIRPDFDCTPTPAAGEPSFPPPPDAIQNRFGSFAMSPDFQTFLTVDAYEGNSPPSDCNNRPLFYDRKGATDYALFPDNTTSPDAALAALGNLEPGSAGLGLNPSFPMGAGVSGNGKIAGLTVFSGRNIGSVYLYARGNKSYAPLFDPTRTVTILKNPGNLGQTNNNDFFGKSLLFNEDGKYLLVAADFGASIDDGGVVFTFSPNPNFLPDLSAPVPYYQQDLDIGQARPPPEYTSKTFGAAMATNKAFGILAVTDSTLNRLYIFSRSADNPGWIRNINYHEALVTTTGDFGTQVAMDQSQFTRVIVNNPSANQIFVYRLTGSDELSRVQIIQVPSVSAPGGTNLFGYRMATTSELRGLAVSTFLQVNQSGDNETQFRNFIFLYRYNRNSNQYEENSDVDPQFIPAPSQAAASLAFLFGNPRSLTLAVSNQQQNQLLVYSTANALPAGQ